MLVLCLSLQAGEIPKGMQFSLSPLFTAYRRAREDLVPSGAL